MKKNPSDRIPSSDLTAYERWELPLLDERGNEVWVHDDDMDLKPLTAEDLENIRREAAEDGLREGREQGYKEGFEKGRADGHPAGRQQGYEEGLKAGHEEAEAARSAEISARLNQLQTLMGELLDPLERHTDNLETALLNLTLSLARAVIHRELQLDSSQVGAVLKQAIAALPSADESIRIHVSPADVQWVQAVAGRFEAGARVIEDESVMPGGCRVENRNSLVDLTVEKRFQKAVQAMLDRQLGGGEAPAQGELDALMGALTDFHRDVLESSPAEGAAETAPGAPVPDADPGPVPDAAEPPSAQAPRITTPGRDHSEDGNEPADR